MILANTFAKNIQYSWKGGWHRFAKDLRLIQPRSIINTNEINLYYKNNCDITATETFKTTKKMDKFIAKRPKLSNLANELEEERKNTAESVMKFKFNKKRIRVLSETDIVKENCKGIVYWMFRDSRVQDNWALLYSQKLAIKNSVPLHVLFCLLPKFLEATIRHFKFLLKNLEQVDSDCKNLNINFHLVYGQPNEEIIKFVKKYNMGAVITDFFPLRMHVDWVNDLKNNLSKDVPICQVDAHNIVPCWEASNKLEYSARTIRPKITLKLNEYLTGFPPVIKHPFTTKSKFEVNDWENALSHLKVDKSVEEVEWAKPGYKEGILELDRFIQNRLKVYESKRNDPLGNALSNLSPWFHFGMISVQRCILEVSKHKKNHEKSVQVFLEEAIVRRELSDNFCFYNENYDNLKGAYQWAIDSLNNHRKDKREYIYTLKEFETSLTHDDLWNSAQNQLVRDGKMHGFLRMYWAKKILEWTRSPEEALEWAIYLNDKYSMDGRDPSGYVGCMWSICGVHDQGWRERSVFGKIRFMNYKGCERKFDVKAFVARWGGKVHIKKK